MPRHKRRIVIPEIVEIAASLRRSGRNRATSVRHVNTASTPGGNGTTFATTGPDRAYASMLNWEIPEPVETKHTKVRPVQSTKQSLDDKLSKFKFLVGG
jgi:hypothetical protein